MLRSKLTDMHEAKISLEQQVENLESNASSQPQRKSKPGKKQRQERRMAATAAAAAAAGGGAAAAAPAAAAADAASNDFEAKLASMFLGSVGGQFITNCRSSFGTRDSPED